MYWEMIQKGVQGFYQSTPFVHTKPVIMDDCYVQISSADIDPPSGHEPAGDFSGNPGKVWRNN
jgi:hypothetical protein